MSPAIMWSYAVIASSIAILGIYLPVIALALFSVVVSWTFGFPNQTREVGGQRLPSKRSFLLSLTTPAACDLTTDRFCIVCRDKCEDPVHLAPCGHITCNGCVREWVDGEQNRCAECLQVLFVLPESHSTHVNKVRITPKRGNVSHD